MEGGITSAQHGRTPPARGGFTLTASFLIVVMVCQQGMRSATMAFFILGQDQDDYGDGFEQDQSFNGEIYNVNMWNRVLPADEILHMSTDCADGVGNHLRWKDFVDADVYGDVTKTSPVSCVP